jgi:hypothetical protein
MESDERRRKIVAALADAASTTHFNIKSERHCITRHYLTSARAPVRCGLSATDRTGAAAETGIDADFYIFRDRSNDKVLPWDIIDGGMKASFFHAEFDKSLREEWTLPPKRQQENARLLPVIG